jgi:hypothetical protein
MYSLGQSARKILQCSVVATRRWPGRDMLVDQPKVFVIMPFREKLVDIGTPKYDQAGN